MSIVLAVIELRSTQQHQSRWHYNQNHPFCQSIALTYMQCPFLRILCYNYVELHIKRAEEWTNAEIQLY